MLSSTGEAPGTWPPAEGGADAAAVSAAALCAQHSTAASDETTTGRRMGPTLVDRGRRLNPGWLELKSIARNDEPAVADRRSAFDPRELRPRLLGRQPLGRGGGRVVDPDRKRRDDVA